MSSQTKRIKGADEDDIAFLQVIIIITFFQNIQVYHSLIISHPFGQVSRSGCLHFQVKDRMFFILDIYIKTDTFGTRCYVNVFLHLWIFDFCNLNPKDCFQKRFYISGITHDHTKHKVVFEFQFFVCFHHSHSSLAHIHFFLSYVALYNTAFRIAIDKSIKFWWVNSST